MKILVLSILILSFAVIGYLISFNWWWKFCFCSFTREGWSILLWRKVLLGDKHHCGDDVEWRGLWRWIGGEVPTMAKSWSGNLTTKLDERKWGIADSVCQKTYYIRWSDEETTFKIWKITEQLRHWLKLLDTWKNHTHYFFVRRTLSCCLADKCLYQIYDIM